MTEAELLAQPAEAYMNAEQQAFFRDLLLRQRAELQARIEEEFQALREQEPSSDPADIGSAEEQRQWQLRVLEREKKLLDKIDEALDAIAAANTAGAPKPANPSACSACCCAPPRRCPSRRNNARNSAKNTNDPPERPP